MSPDASSDHSGVGGPYGEAGADDRYDRPDPAGASPRLRHQMLCPVGDRQAAGMPRRTAPERRRLPD